MHPMALLRSRSRYVRLIALAAVLTGLYYISSRPASRTSPSASAKPMIRWSRNSNSNDDVPHFEEPRAKMPPRPPLSTKHKTRNGRPPRYGPDAASPRGSSGSRGGSQVASQQQPDPVSPGQEEIGKRTSPVDPLPEPPPGVHLPGTPVFSDPLEHQFNSWKPPDYVPRSKSARKKKTQSDLDGGRDVPDPFPLLSRSPPPSLAELNLAGRVRGRGGEQPETPLLIGFTRNWPQLLQCVVSYLAAGWPAGEIWVVENTGTMHANRDGRLGLQNPFYLNHTQLRMLGVGVVVTPTLLTFAQLQNFYAWTALERNWTEYFWSHQDLLVFSADNSTRREDNLHARATSVLSYLRRPGVPKWANHFFAYDHLTLVHRDAILDVGGWDTHIPYYATDCDMYDRLMWAGYWQGETSIGIILDVATVLDDVGALLGIPGIYAAFPGDLGPETEKDQYRPPQEGGGVEGGQKVVGKQRRAAKMENPYSKAEGERSRDLISAHGETWEHLVEVGRRMEQGKDTDGGGVRNTWQLRQSGGQGEPFYRDPEGFETGLRMMIDTGRRVFAEKWGHRGCDIAQIGLKAEDEWKVEKDWDPKTEGDGSEGDDW